MVKRHRYVNFDGMDDERSTGKMMDFDYCEEYL